MWAVQVKFKPYVTWWFTAMERLAGYYIVFFIYKCAGILLTSTYITQWVLATPTLIGT